MELNSNFLGATAVSIIVFSLIILFIKDVIRDSVETDNRLETEISNLDFSESGQVIQKSYQAKKEYKQCRGCGAPSLENTCRYCGSEIKDYNDFAENGYPSKSTYKLNDKKNEDDMCRQYWNDARNENVHIMKCLLEKTQKHIKEGSAV